MQEQVNKFKVGARVRIVEAPRVLADRTVLGCTGTVEEHSSDFSDLQWVRLDNGVEPKDRSLSDKGRYLADDRELELYVEPVPSTEQTPAELLEENKSLLKQIERLEARLARKREFLEGNREAIRQQLSGQVQVSFALSNEVQDDVIQVCKDNENSLRSNLTRAVNQMVEEIIMRGEGRQPALRQAVGYCSTARDA